MGIEPTAQPWKGWVLPLYDPRARIFTFYTKTLVIVNCLWYIYYYGPLAQLVEHVTFNDGVHGSSP